MSQDEVTQPLPQRLVPHYVTMTDAPHGAFVVNNWTGREVRNFPSRRGNPGTYGSQEGAQLAAETYASELNAPETALDFASRLALWIDGLGGLAGDGELTAGDILEDVAKILDHHIGQLRGVKVEPLDQTKLHVQAPWVNR